MGTTRENNYREHEYIEGKYLICRMGSGYWYIYEMSLFEGEPVEYDPQAISDTGYDFTTLRNARKWCKENQ